MYGILDIADIDSDTGTDDLLLCAFAAPTKVVSNTTVRGGDTMSLRRIRYRSTAQRWQIDSDTAIMDGSSDLFAHQIQNDVVNTIYVRPPLPVKNLSVTTGHVRPAAGDSVAYPIPGAGFAVSNGTAALSANFSIGATSVSITMDVSSEAFKTDFLRFDDHDKVYMITDVQSVVPAAHTSVVSIFPPLTAAVISSEVVFLGKRATMKMLYDLGSVLGVSYVDGILADPGRVSLVEEL